MLGVYVTELTIGFDGLMVLILVAFTSHSPIFILYYLKI